MNEYFGFHFGRLVLRDEAAAEFAFEFGELEVSEVHILLISNLSVVFQHFLLQLVMCLAPLLDCLLESSALFPAAFLSCVGYILILPIVHSVLVLV